MPAPKKYPDELREGAVRMVFEIREQTGQRKGALAQVGAQLGINPETLRNWVNQAEVDDGIRPGTSTDDRQRIVNRYLLGRVSRYLTVSTRARERSCSTASRVERAPGRMPHELTSCLVEVRPCLV